MKVIKKRIIVFILCFTLFTCGFVHSDPVKEVKASVTVATVSLFLLGLTALGVTYYSQVGSSSLENDIDSYARANNTDSSSYLNAFGNVVVDSAKNAVKFTAAQIYLLKEFISYQVSNHYVSNVPINSSSLSYISLWGYPALIRVSGGSTFSFTNSSGNTFNFLVSANDASITGSFYVFFVSNLPINNSSNSLTDLVIVSGTSNYNGNFPTIKNISSDTVLNPYSNLSGSLVGKFYSFSASCNRLPSRLLSFSVNNRMFTNAYFRYDSSEYSSIEGLALIRKRLGINDNTNRVVIPNYYLDSSVYSNIASDKDLVITSPDLIDKAIDNAKVRNPSATSITVEDVAAAIDDTAVGVIDPAAEDEEDKVIAPPISLDDDFSITQDNAITDTVVEDLDIPEPLPPEPPPVIPEIDSALAAKFPFSIFSDFILIMSIFDEEPEAPVFNLGFTALGRDFQFTIDLSAFDSVASVVRTMELLAFIVGIIFVTIKFMQGGSD